MLKSVVVVVFFACCGLLAFAQQNSGPVDRAAPQDFSVPQKFALVIGNGAYTNVSALHNPVNDANDMAAVLRELGFAVDVLADADLHEMDDAVTLLKSRLSASRNSYGFFFYAGHGVQSNGENYLLPVNSDIPSENYLRDRTLSVQVILNELNDAGNELNIVVLDACRDNPFGWIRSGNRGLALINHQPADSIIVYATSAGSTAKDGEGRNGLFTAQLLNNLRIPGLEVSEVFRLTGADVARISDRKQIPAIYNQYFGVAYLGEMPPDMTSATARPAPLPSPAPAPDKNSDTDRSKYFWSIGASAGTSFAAPFFVGTVNGTLAPFRNSFFEPGVDIGLLSGAADVGYYSVCPFLHYAAFLPLAQTGAFYAGAGGSYFMAEYNFPEGKVPLNFFAFDVTGGFRFNNGIVVSYTLRTDFSTAANTLSVGYRYRFN